MPFFLNISIFHWKQPIRIHHINKAMKSFFLPVSIHLVAGFAIIYLFSIHCCYCYLLYTSRSFLIFLYVECWFSFSLKRCSFVCQKEIWYQPKCVYIIIIFNYMENKEWAEQGEFSVPCIWNENWVALYGLALSVLVCVLRAPDIFYTLVIIAKCVR